MSVCQYTWRDNIFLVKSDNVLKRLRSTVYTPFIQVRFKKGDTIDHNIYLYLIKRFFPPSLPVGTSSFVIICPNDITVGTQPGETFARVNFNAPQVIGQTNGRVTFTYDPPQTTMFPIGSSTVVVTVEDNTSVMTCTFAVIVRGKKKKEGKDDSFKCSCCAFFSLTFSGAESPFKRAQFANEIISFHCDNEFKTWLLDLENMANNILKEEVNPAINIGLCR